jgi:UMF1 family MFS transporter
VPEFMNRKQVAAWALFDFANSAYPAVITAAIFGAYYANTVVDNEGGLGDLWLARAASLSVLFVAVSSPVLGAVADRAGVRKKLLFLYTFMCVLFVSLFVTIEPGMVVWGFLLYMLANIGFEGAMVFYNAYLPDLAPPERRGFVSGLGFAAGYAGSIAALLIAYPLLAREHYNLTWLSVAAFFAVFSIPSFLFLPKDQPGEETLLRAAYQGVVGFRSLVGEVLRERELRRFLIAFFFYIDGVLTVILVTGTYATKTLGFNDTERILLFLVVQISALVGALGLAKPTDVWGPKRVITLTLLLWTSLTVATFFVYSKPGFFVIAVVAGFGLGAVQSASRAMMAALIPKGKEAEMFGFYAFCGKSSSIMGPMVFGMVSYTLAGNQRAAVLAVGAFFLIGLVLLQRVNDPVLARADALKRGASQN